MQQRPFRLGDIVDDYCPRERRVTNHAVVAIIDRQVRQTRCKTCDAEHVYRAGRVPSRRVRKEESGVLHKQLPEVMHNRSEEAVVDDAAASESIVEVVASEADPVETHAINRSESENESAADEGPVHRPLIRATLPRHEGQPPARPVPEFTIRQSGGRGGAFRAGDPRLVRHGDRQRGNGGHPAGQGGGGQRFAASRHGGKSGRTGVERSDRFPQRTERTQPHARHERSVHPNRSGKRRPR